MLVGNALNNTLTLFLMMVLLIGVLAILLSGASLAGIFEIGVPVKEGNLHRGLSMGELIGILVAGVMVAGAAVFLLRKV